MYNLIVELLEKNLTIEMTKVEGENCFYIQINSETDKGMEQYFYTPRELELSLKEAIEYFK